MCQLCQGESWTAQVSSLLPRQGKVEGRDSQRCWSPRWDRQWNRMHGCSSVVWQEPMIQGSELRAMTTYMNNPSFISHLQAALPWHQKCLCPKQGWLPQSTLHALYSHRTVLSAGSVAKTCSSFPAWPGTFASPFSLSHHRCLSSEDSSLFFRTNCQSSCQKFARRASILPST